MDRFTSLVQPSSAPSAFMAPMATPLSLSTDMQPALKISERDVNQLFQKQKTRNAPGPDGVSPSWLKARADQLAPVFTQKFSRSLELCEVPSCFKRSTIIPVPKKTTDTELNDYRPVALTSVVMKSFERLVLAHLKNNWTPTGSPTVGLLSKQDTYPVCGLQHDHPRNPLF
ncbi:hypothetical protein NFI96_006335 [Prochilodus magdalenae]|nr:hypothetical protein NFI96_006335 [Prochilodus magdalenae]